jgi:putative salt-induced outer membrane protein
MSKLVVVAVLCTAASASAENPKFEYGKADDVAKVKGTEWNASAEVGLVFTTGNSETTTVSAGATAARKTGNNKLQVEGNLTYARSSVRVLSDNNGNGMIDDASEIESVASTTAETITSRLRYDRFLTASNSLYIAALAARDLPAGKEAVVGGQVGYSRLLYKSKTAEAVAEVGIDYSRENLVTGPVVQILSARGFLGYKAELTEGTTFDTSVDVLTNLNKETLPTTENPEAKFGEDTRVALKLAVSSKIGKNLAVQSSIEAKYDHAPGPLTIKSLAMDYVPEASRLDTIMKASLIYTIF